MSEFFKNLIERIQTQKSLQIVLSVVALSAVGGGAAFFWTSKHKADELVMKPVLVETKRVALGPVGRTYRATGELESVDFVQLLPEMEGRIQKMLIEQGMPVYKGQLLIQLDDRLLRAQLQEAKAKVTLAQAEYDRTKKLYDKQFVSRAIFDEKKFNLNAAEAALEIAKVRVEQTKIVAPFDGVVGLTKFSEGAMVSRSQEIGTIVMLDPLYVDFSVPESLVRDLEVGTPVEVTVDGTDGLPMEAKIKAIDSRAQTGTHSVRVRALLDNKEQLMRAGQFARVVVHLGDEQQALLVPMDAVDQEGDRFYVYTVLDGVALRKPVTVGVRSGTDMEIKEGLFEGDKVITVGHVNIYPGVSVIESEPEPEPEKADQEKAGVKK